MSNIRAKLSKRNPYWIPEERYHELRYFCRQYPEWERRYNEINSRSSSVFDQLADSSNHIPDNTADDAIRKLYYTERIALVKSTAKAIDKQLYKYLLKGVTEGYSYNYLRTVCDIPCGRDLYYEKYRQFFWLLDKKRK